LSSATSSNGSGSSGSNSNSNSNSSGHKRSYPNKINKASYKTINSSDVISSEGSSPMKGNINKPTSSLSSSFSSSSTTTTASSSNMFDKSIVVDTSSKCQINDFLTTTLAYLPYVTADEPLQIIFWINRNISVSTSLLLHRLKDKLMIIGAVVRSDGAMLPPMIGSKTKSNQASTNKKSMSSSSSSSNSSNNSNSSTDGSGAVISSRSSSDGSGGRTVKTPSSISKPSLSSSTNSPTIHESDLIINDQGMMCFLLCNHCQHLSIHMYIHMSVHCCSCI
jgi:hypothetical protein